jgi:hypothetical protein
MPDDGKITIQLDPRTAQQLAERAREEGVSPEQYASDLVTEGIRIDLHDVPPGLVVSDEELRASMAEQLRKIESGEAELIPHEQVMAEARAKLAAARARKG